MRGLYIVDWDLNNFSDGVVKKIRNQVACFEQELGPVDVVDRNALEYKAWQRVCSSGLSWLRLQGVYRAELLLKCKLCDEDYVRSLDYIYIRKFVFSKKGIRYLGHAKKVNPNLKILLEIPTYPYDRECKVYNLLSNIEDRRTRNLLSAVVDRVVTYSDDTKIFGIRTIRISNGANYDAIGVRKPTAHDGINVIAVALFDNWHGYDRFIAGMKLDMDIVKGNKIRLFLVGRGRALDKYKKMADRDLGENVIFCGPKFGKELDDLYDSSDIALDAMGRHRSNVYYNSSLKGKEYCAKGIPSISGVKTELDGLQGAYYYMRIPADETPVDMNTVVSFYHALYDGKDAALLSNSIREATRVHFDMKNVVKPVTQYLQY